MGAPIAARQRAPIWEKHALAAEGASRNPMGAPMAFDLKHFLSRVPPDSLRGYFGERAKEESASIDWSLPQARIVDAIVAMMDALPPKKRSEIWAECEIAGQFRSDTGRRALRSVIADQQDRL